MVCAKDTCSPLSFMWMWGALSLMWDGGVWPCSINITSREEGSCPTDLLVAPCAVPSASLKEFGASREEGQ